MRDETSTSESSSAPGETGTAAPPVTRDRSAGMPLGPLLLCALGVVYGDIGTSPLYAVRECFNPAHGGVALTAENILGVLALIFWSLTLVVTIKYLSVVLRADNDGEGGVLALMALVLPRPGESRHTIGGGAVVVLGLAGMALLTSEGTITPAISVLSAIEGLEVATPIFRPLVVPLTLGVLIALFVHQKNGTARLGKVFGIVMVVWFLALSVMGVYGIIQEPGVLMALNPWYALKFFAVHRLHGLIVLGAVVLCVTGCEALYADLGHFGRRPITLAWYGVVFPAVVLNYFGQGAILLSQGESAMANPFFALAPGLWLYPAVILATLAAVIASQALISGAFSLARQAIQMGYLPRLTIVHTSQTMPGQIYIPEVNTTLMIACIALVLGFRNSSGLAAAYGIAVVGAMSVTSILIFKVQMEKWGWNFWQALSITGIFLVLDGFFLIGNLIKVVHGGWVPLLLGALVFIVMLTWNRGIAFMRKRERADALMLDDFVKHLDLSRIPRVKGTGVFMGKEPSVVPRVLLHHLKHNKVLHEQVVVMAAVTENVPTVPDVRRVAVHPLGSGFFNVTVRTGFMQSIDVQETLQQCNKAGLSMGRDVSYYVGHQTLRLVGRVQWPRWRKTLFAYLFHNQRSAINFLGLPPNRVVELGEQTEL
ncbi:MAG: KUP/HAK/KT family potassium transporter [bacterium]